MNANRLFHAQYDSVHDQFDVILYRFVMYITLQGSGLLPSIILKIMLRSMNNYF